MESKEYFEKIMQDYNQNGKGRSLRKYDERFVDMVFNVVMGMPSMKAALEHEGKRKKKLLGNIDRLKAVAMMWLRGSQYHEIAKMVGINVDQAIVIVMFLQGAIHDKAVGMMTFMQHSKGLDNNAAIYWPEYLRLGINKEPCLICTERRFLSVSNFTLLWNSLMPLAVALKWKGVLRVRL